MKILASAFLCASVPLSGFGIARAQAHLATPPAASSSYAGESFVHERLHRVYTFAADGTGSKEISGVIAVHNQAGVKALSVLPFDFASSGAHVEIDYVRVRHADGSITTTPASDAQELPLEVTRQAPVYSDLKEEQIPVRSLREGDHLEYKIRIVRTKPESPGHIWGSDSFVTPSSGFVVLSETLELHLPKDIYMQVWSPQHKPTVTESGAERVYRWQSAQPLPIAGKDRNALLLMDNNPTLGTSDDPRPPDVAWTSFHSWAEVGAWYRGLEGSRTDPDADIRARTTTVTAGDTTEQQKASAIYGFVGTQIRYIGVDFGTGRLQPHAAEDVMSNQYGDCKDKSILLTSMLFAAGIQSATVLVGAGIPFIEDVPSPGAFNHAINLVQIDNKPVWLDSTAEVAPFGLLVSAIRGKKALVIPLTGEAHIETTPLAPSPTPAYHYTSIGVLDEHGTSTSRITMDLRGDGEIPVREAVRSVSHAQWDQLMQNISESLSFSGKVTDTQFSKPDDTSSPFHFSYTYVREKNGDWDNLRILSQLPPAGLVDIDEKKPPVTPIELGIPQVITEHAEMKLPKGWHADLPPFVHAKSPFATMDVTYKFENGTLTTDRRLEILKPNIPASDWPAYHHWIADAKLNNDPYIQLSSGTTTSTTTASNTSSWSIDNPAAADLIRKAVDAEIKQDWTSARKDVDDAQVLNPGQPYLWSHYGFLAQQKGDLDTAVTDYTRELARHPGEENVSGLLVSVLMHQGKPDDAIAVLHATIDRDPANTGMVLMLASILSRRGQIAAAETALRAGIAANPDSVGLRVRLGIALLHDGQNDKQNLEGETLLRDVITTTDDASALNNAAYALADASLDLPLAEQASRHSLDLLDQATNNGETGRAALLRANLLVSAWDTFGWILFREGKTAEAEPWVRAAWRNGNSAESGYHLAMILQKQNHPSQALEEIDLAASGERGTNATAIQKLISDDRTDLLKTGATAPTQNSRLKLQDQRTYTLPRGKVTPTGQGWANIEIELTPQAITAFRIVQGDDTLQPLASAIQHLNLDLQIPAQSHARLLRSGVLSCHTNSTCQLVLISPRSSM